MEGDSGVQQVTVNRHVQMKVVEREMNNSDEEFRVM